MYIDYNCFSPLHMCTVFIICYRIWAFFSFQLKTQGRGEILVSLCYQPAANRITAVVLKARNLPKMDITGLSGKKKKKRKHRDSERKREKKLKERERERNHFLLLQDRQIDASCLNWHPENPNHFKNLQDQARLTSIVSIVV